MCSRYIFYIYFFIVLFILSLNVIINCGVIFGLTAELRMMIYLVTVCGEQLQAGKQRKILVSHANYGNQDYDLHMLCYSSIEARPGYTVNFIFKAMEIENEVDMAIGNNKWCVTYSLCLAYI